MTSPLVETAPFAVDVRGLRHVFADGTVALDGIDLRILRGSFVALLGPSGCGKSTLLRLVAGLDRPTSGSLTVAESARRGTKTSLAFVFQDAHLLPWRTVIENVALPLELRGVSRTEAAKLALGCIAEVELSEAATRFPDELSGGMRMRVSIARALVTEPDILLLDEPFAALDELTRQRLDERLRLLWAEKRMTVLFVTHSLSEAVYLAERAIVMSKRPGRVVLDHAVDLPLLRRGALRADVAFARQTALLYDALEANEPANGAMAARA
ncbi:MAG TPA: ABC transporter ATP-binding protein [Polyangiaceae bacterium]|nr:ABC transporter ATP-binding protein [Polyangiaceae bacterium]